MFANGWGYEYLHTVMTGVNKCAMEENVDIFAFVNYSAASDSAAENLGEFNIFTLPRLDDYDGVLLMANSFNDPMEVEYLHRKMLETKLPVLSLEYELMGLDFLGTENYSGMYEMAEHMFKVHGAKRPVLIGGPKGHLESDTRMKAVLDAAADYQVEIPDDCITHGNWSDTSSHDIMEQWGTEHEGIPDVVFCANDIMAMGVCAWAEVHGYNVPDDIKVGSFDNIEIGQIFYPALTTVDRDWEKMGFEGMKLLLRKMNGETIPNRNIIKTHLICGESCGCHLSPEKEKRRLTVGREAYTKRNLSMKREQHFRNLYKFLHKNDTAEELHRALNGYLAGDHDLEGASCAIFLEKDFFDAEDGRELRSDGYSDVAHMIFSMENGETKKDEIIDYRKELFGRTEASEESQMYLITPLHGENKSFGYAAFATDLSIVDNYTLYSWTKCMDQCMEQIRQNVKIATLTKTLRKLSVTDVLTGVYNRAGCEKMAYPYFSECRKAKRRGVLLLADVDHMKHINDKYGHVHGDMALRLVADAIRESVPEDWIVSRYGGDEFFVAGQCEEGETIDYFADKITKCLEHSVEQSQLPYKVSVSIGGTILLADQEFVLEKAIKEADDCMYAIKKEHHERTT